MARPRMRDSKRFLIHHQYTTRLGCEVKRESEVAVRYSTLETRASGSVRGTPSRAEDSLVFLRRKHQMHYDLTTISLMRWSRRRAESAYTTDSQVGKQNTCRVEGVHGRVSWRPRLRERASWCPHLQSIHLLLNNLTIGHLRNTPYR